MKNGFPFLLLCISFFCLPASFIAQVQLGMDLNGEAENDRSGAAVSLSEDGTRIAIGAAENDGNGINAGHVRVYEWNGTSWEQLGVDLDGEATLDGFGGSVTLSDDGNRLIVGAKGNDSAGQNTGSATIFAWDGFSWTPLGNSLYGEHPEDEFGREVALSGNGNRVIVGTRANDDNGENAGHVRVFEYQNGNWTQMGSDLDGENQNHLFGNSVAISEDGSIIAAGATGAMSFRGQVRIFEWQDSIWEQRGVTLLGEASNDHFGISVSLSANGDHLAVGAIFNDGAGSNSGHTRVYSFDGTNYVQQGQDLNGEAANDQFGRTISLSSNGQLLAVGAPSNDGNGSSAGHARLFEWINGAWSQVGQDIDGETGADQAGYVSLNGFGNIVAVGAIGNDSNGSFSGHVRVFGDLPSPISKPQLDLSLIHVYPNPTSVLINFSDYPIQRLQFYNIHGALVLTQNNFFGAVNLQHLPDGMYFMRLVHDGKTQVIPIQKKAN